MASPELRLVDYRDPTLTAPCGVFDFAAPPFDPTEFAHALVELMYAQGGIGIAATQVGIPVNVFAMRNSGPEGDFVCFNPRVVHLSNETIALDESCLSFPGLTLNIERPRHARLRFQGPNGETFTRQFTGITARCVLHEMDHLSGRHWFEGHVSRLKLERAIKRSRHEYIGILKFAKKG